MPWYIGGDAGNKIGRLLYLRLRIIEAGHEQGDNLDPEALVEQVPDGIQNRLEPPPELAIGPVVKALQVDLVAVQPGS